MPSCREAWYFQAFEYAGVAAAAAKMPARKLDWLGQLRLQKQQKLQAARQQTAGQGASGTR